MPDAPSDNPPPVPLETDEIFARFRRWCAEKPAQVVLMGASLGVLVYFYGFYKTFSNGLLTTAVWASESWNSENNQEHSWLIMPIFFFLIWYHRDKINAAPKKSSSWGLVPLLLGVLAFVAAVRMIDPRTAIISLPLIIYGSVFFLWGRAVARIFIFPCLFLLFMVPVGGFVQGTVSLQLLVSAAVKFLATLIGVQVQTIGTGLRAMDGTFNFDIAEGCSGIRSLMAMTTLSALYVHFTQRETWKQWVIFGGSIVFALIGNIGRIFSVVLIARFISEPFAGGIYHDWSAFIFFPVAVGAMLGFTKLLNMDWRRLAGEALKPETPVVGAGKKSTSPVSYDY
jgi:exosortase